MTRYYVTMTWEDWPEGGSYGTVVEADSPEDAEAEARQEMAETRLHGIDADADEILSLWGDSWHVVDCYDLDEFIAYHLSALRPGDEINGMVLVPREPTVEMQNAGWRAVDQQGFEAEDTEVAPIYRAMLSVLTTPNGGEDE